MKFTLRLPDNEAAIIEKHCALTNRTKTDVFREFVRSLDQKNWYLEGEQQSNYSLTTVTDGTTQGQMIGLFNPYPSLAYPLEEQVEGLAHED